MISRRIAALSIVVISNFTTHVSFAQKQTEQLPVPITIRVIDPSKSVVPDACVIIRSSSEGSNFSRETNSSGLLPAVLRPGKYDVTVTGSGFAKAVVELEVTRDSPRTFEIKMAIGTSSGLPVTSIHPFSKLPPNATDLVCPRATTIK